jgi:thioredoxin reductase (NADPH)
MVDVLVVGAGPVGLAAALWAKRLGLSHLVLEKGTVAHTIYRFPGTWSSSPRPRTLRSAATP